MTCADYGIWEPVVAGDSVFNCAVFGATFLPVTPIRISITIVIAATRPNTIIDLLPPFEPSVMGLSAMEISPQLPFVQAADMG
jgi:hypothetical protein